MRTDLSPACQQMWQEYLDVVPDAEKAQRWFYGVLRLGATPESADDGALLISRGIKTARSSLLWEYEAEFRPLPQVGSLSIVENGRDQPVCVVKTTQVDTRPFREVDLRFAYDYGEWDRSLKTWRLECWEAFGAQCATLEREADHKMPIVCERFRVVFP